MSALLSSKASKEALELAKGLWLPRNVVTEKINILGQSGGGKTYLAMKLAELMLQAGAQVVVVDLVGVWWGLRSSADGQSAGFPVLVIGGDHGDMPLNPLAGAHIADLVVERRIPVVLDVSDLDEEEMGVFVADFLHRLFRQKKRQSSAMHLFFEEAQELFPEQLSTKAEVRLRKVGTRICKIGRNRGIGYTTVTQEPQSVSKRILNQAGTVIAVRTIGSQEREAVARTARSRTRSKADLNLIEVLPELETGQAIVFSPAWLKFIGQVNILPKTTFDSSKTPEVGAAPAEPNVLAPVEIDQLRQAMAEQIAAVESQDVEALQRRVRQLEVKLASVPPPAPPIEVPAITVDDRKLLRELGDRLFAVTRALLEVDKRLGSDTMMLTLPRTAAAAIAETPKTVVVAAAPKRAKHSPTDADDSGGEASIAGPLAVLAAVGRPMPVERLAMFSGLVASGGGFRKVLKALRESELVSGDVEVTLTSTGRDAAKQGDAAFSLSAAWAKWRSKLGEALTELVDVLHSSGSMPAEKLAAAVGKSRNGGGFRKDLKKLRSAGFIEKGDDPVQLTSAARSLLEGAPARAARTHAQIVESWRGRLSDGPRNLFDVLVPAGAPYTITEAQLAERVGMAATGGGFRKNLKKLRTLGLVLETDEGVSASPSLWP